MKYRILFIVPLFLLIYTISYAKPSITNIRPLNCLAGDYVFITGKDFDPDKDKNTVKFFDNVTAPVSYATPTLLVVVVPKDARTGSIIVTTGSGDATYDKIITLGTSTITSFSPDRGSVGSTVVIKGQNFDSAPGMNKVTFYDLIEAKIVREMPDRLEVTVPEKAQSGPITVTNSKGTISTKESFIILIPPTIRRIDPVFGIPGSRVVIHGTNFEPTAINNKVLFDGIPANIADKTSIESPANTLVVTVPYAAGSGYISVLNSNGTATSPNTFTVTGPEYVIHFIGGGTVNYWSSNSSGNSSVEPLFGFVGVHKIPVQYTWNMDNPYHKDGALLVGGELTYRGVAADQALAANNPNGVALSGLAAAKSIGLFGNATMPFLKGDTFSVGLCGMMGYEFLTSDNFKHDAQYSNGIHIRIQDDQDPLYFLQIGYGNTEYLSHSRLLIDLSGPIINGVIGQKDNVSHNFYDRNYTDFYYFINVNRSLIGRKDDTVIFGIKAVISASKLLGIFNPDNVLINKKSE